MIEIRQLPGMRLTVRKLLETRAWISDDGVYRYFLWRPVPSHAQDAQSVMLFVMLNPSTADGLANDATIEACIRQAKARGCRQIWVANLFAYRATDPKDLYGAYNPVGPRNLEVLRVLAKASCRPENKIIPVMAWGNHGTFRDMASLVSTIFQDVRCYAFAHNRATGQPTHPLYRKVSEPLVPFKPISWG